ncbi:cyclodeaminase/cyclohydrolase family protein [Gaiella sp.]|uniref:cyclodeaminase/cyclohydrolase family protein n=1 Tax=Gaiella sp. TaxID=2663207 RepID=UPI003264ED3D
MSVFNDDAGRSGSTVSLHGFLDALEAPAPSPCGGTAAAVSAAMAAALVTMVGRGSSTWIDGAGIAAQARALRARLVALGEDDAAAFEKVLVTMRDRIGSPEQRDFAIGAALLRAAEVPLQIGEAAADVAELAAIAAREGAPHLRPDASAAAVLAEASVRAATHLVEINLAVVPGDQHYESAARLAAAAAAARERALR